MSFQKIIYYFLNLTLRLLTSIISRQILKTRLATQASAFGHSSLGVWPTQATQVNDPSGYCRAVTARVVRITKRGC